MLTLSPPPPKETAAVLVAATDSSPVFWLNLHCLPITGAAESCKDKPHHWPPTPGPSPPPTPPPAPDGKHPNRWWGWLLGAAGAVLAVGGAGYGGGVAVRKQIAKMRQKHVGPGGRGIPAGAEYMVRATFANLFRSMGDSYSNWIALEKLWFPVSQILSSKVQLVAHETAQAQPVGL
jgi:hypothetical protein